MGFVPTIVQWTCGWQTLDETHGFTHGKKDTYTNPIYKGKPHTLPIATQKPQLTLCELVKMINAF